MTSAAAKRYARAVFELAQEDRAVDAWRRRLATVRELVSLPELEPVLANRAISGSSPT